MLDELDFEKPLTEIENRLVQLRAAEDPRGSRDEIARLEDRLGRLQQKIYGGLTAWQRAQIARHPKRPHTLDFVGLLLEDWVELHGDRVYGDDKAIVGGLARFDGAPVVAIGHQKGRDTRENIARNFGMPHPEGYRKALRLMQLAEKFGAPIVTFIDTPGAYPGLGAEERGQAEAIARNLREMAGLATPIVCIVTGEGGSGGALAIGVGNRVLMLEYAIYSVISPEGCAAILWGTPPKRRRPPGSCGSRRRNCSAWGSLMASFPNRSGEPIATGSRPPPICARRSAISSGDCVGGRAPRSSKSGMSASAGSVSSTRSADAARVDMLSDEC